MGWGVRNRRVWGRSGPNKDYDTGETILETGGQMMLRSKCLKISKCLLVLGQERSGRC